MSNKIKVTAIICLSPYSGGMELDSIKLTKKLSSYTKIILIAKEKSFIADKTKKIYSDKICLETISFYNNLSFNIIFGVRNIIKKYNINNVIFFGASELKSLYFSFINLNINLIIRHGSVKNTPKKDYIHQLLYSKVNYHVSICKYLLKNVRKIIPFSKNTQEKLIYPSFVFTKPKHISQKKLTILHISRIVQKKGHIDAIKACEVLIINNIDFRFNIVGELNKKYKKEFMEFYDNCNYKDKINLVGFKDNVAPYIQEADIFLFPSYGEGFGNVLIEAIMNNIICITYDNTTFPEFKKLGLYFKMVETGNIQGLKDTLLNSVNTLEIEKDKSSNNYIIAKKLFPLEQEINKFLEILI